LPQEKALIPEDGKGKDNACSETQKSTGCRPNRNPFERSLKRFLQTNLGEAEDKRCQLLEAQKASFDIAWSEPQICQKTF